MNHSRLLCSVAVVVAIIVVFVIGLNDCLQSSLSLMLPVRLSNCNLPQVVANKLVHKYASN